MKGVWGKILRVDLTKGTCRFEKKDVRVYEDFMGGAGMVAYTLWRECPRGTTAFDPENRLVFAAGPMQGIRQTGASKWTAGAISPAINMNADSAATASFGIELKQAGIDAIIVHGRASEPSCIVVDDDNAEIKKYSELWGLNAYETEDRIKEREGGRFECVTIGQAGEKLLRYANIQTRKKSTLGRCGLGAVMGSKRLKGIALRGSRSVPYHDPAALKKLNNEINRRLARLDRALPFLERCATAGTARATTRFAPQGNLPIKNYQLAEFPAGVEAFKTASYVERLNASPWPCKYCVIQCHNKCEVKEGPYAYKGKGPEYESFAMMGLNTMIDDVEAVAYAGELANMYGMDTISLGAVLAWAMECYEKGVITRKDLYGLDL
ncbi:MAG: aldehyde ferredoxin oxidoreductase N-terminal domain-containing protein, partial [Pseudomonadota bacterium]